MDSQAKGLIKGLENWAKRVTTGYRDVSVQNMSSSFRNGLAFCAIIHHYRPDLINFESLSKENIFENNSLAFSTAEKQLGVPALLEAKDMVEYAQPDRLSIITYLSQLYNCFENQNKVKTLKASNLKRPQSNSSGPPSKVPIVQPQLLAGNRTDKCHVCNHRVFILERLIVDSKLYHTTCFRCNKCNCLLNPGTYVDSDTPGLYECAVCLPEENCSMETQDTESLDSFDGKNDSLTDTPVKPFSPISQNDISSKFRLSESVTNARSNFLQHSLSTKSPEMERVPSPVLRKSTFPAEDTKKVNLKQDSAENSVSVKEKISAFNRNSRSESFFKTPELATTGKFKLSSGVSATNGEVPQSNASPRSRAILSSNSPSDLQQSPSNNSPTVDAVSPSDIKTASVPSVNETNVSQSDKLNCDNLSSPSILNKTPSPRARRSLQLQSPPKEDTSKISSKQFQISDYKRSPRDIFQPNLQPLKLSIPSVNSSSKRESSGLSLTQNITSPDTARTGGIEIPQIRSTYARTLPRPVSASVLSSKDKSDEAVSSSDTNLSDVLHSKWSRTTPRRSSLESNSKTNEAVSESVVSNSVDVGGKGLSRDDSEKTGLDTKFETKQSGSISNENIFKRDIKDTPVPSVRRSLEKRNANLDNSPAVHNKVGSSVKPFSLNTGMVLPEISVQSDDSSKPIKSIEIVKKEAVKPNEPEKLYPDDLNPFGDEEEEEEYPDDLNPFGDDEEKPSNSKAVNDYDETKNPFASDEDDADTAPAPLKAATPKSIVSPNNSPFQQSSPFGSVSSPTGSLRGTLKKRLAPKPPKLSDIFPNDSQDSEADVSLNSFKSSPSGVRRNLQTPSPKVRKNKPAPPPPPVPAVRQTSQSDLAANAKQMKDADNMKLKSSSTGADTEAAKIAKKKKRPAPPVPIPKRKDNKKIPLKEILREMKDIEEKQRECERQGREIEILIRDRDKDEEASVEEEEYIMQLFELVNQKNALFRRQAELMYIKRSQRLEEQQAEIELQIRQLMEKPEAEKSDEDRAREDELILELKDIVDQRSSIIDSIEMDRRRELEEDASVQEQIEIKNGDLPITAEIKEKSSGKTKKFKLKKDKKKKTQENENGESKKTSGKKKWLSK